MFALSEVTKFFGQKQVLRNISFSAHTGDIIGFLGVNGAGKTTTMRILLGYLAPTSGLVEISKKNPITNRLDVLKHVGYLPENNPLYTDMSVREYLSFIASIKEDTKWDELTEDIGVAQVLDQKIEELSRGFKQRVGLTAALIGNPQLLILDEPTSGLDPIEQDKIKRHIKKIASKKIVIFSTHILSEVEAIANRLIILDGGVIVYDGKKPVGRGAVEKLFKKLVK